jgi:hypothetical protein
MNSGLATRDSFNDLSNYLNFEPDNNLCFDTPREGLITDIDHHSNSIKYFEIKTNQIIITISNNFSIQIFKTDIQLKSQKFKKRTQGPKKHLKRRGKGLHHLNY